jgi:hypothetical protein
MKAIGKVTSGPRRRRAATAFAAKESGPIRQSVVKINRSAKTSQFFRCGVAITLGSFALLLGGTADATYNANLTGTVASLVTYDNGEVLVALSNQPASNGSCSAIFFELDPPAIGGSTVANDAAFNRMYARLVQAYTAGQPVNLGFDNAGNCAASGYIRVYRVG